MAVPKTTNTAKNTSDAFAQNAVQIICAFRDYIDIVIHNRNQQKEFPKTRTLFEQVKTIFKKVEEKPQLFDVTPHETAIDFCCDKMGIQTANWDERLDAVTPLIPMINHRINENKDDIFSYNHLDALIASVEFIKDFQQNERCFSDLKKLNPRAYNNKNCQKSVFTCVDNTFKSLVKNYRKDMQDIPDLRL